MDKYTQNNAAASSMMTQLISGVMSGEPDSVEEARDVMAAIVAESTPGRLAALLVAVRAVFDVESK